MASDITGYNSPYQLGRTWLSPFYNGVEAPLNTVTKPGGLTYGLALEQTIDYDSFMDRLKIGPLFSHSLLLGGSYQIAPEQRFTFAGGLGLNWIRDSWKSSEDIVTKFGLTALPGTSVAYDVILGPVSITAYDRVSKRPFYGFLQNDIGLAATWQIAPQWSWTPNYTFSKTYDVNRSRFYLPGTPTNQHTVSSLLTFESQGNWSAGVENSLTLYRPKDSRFNNSNGDFYSLGPFVVWNLSKDTRFRLATGYQHSEVEHAAPFFIHPGLGRPSPKPDSDSPYYTLSLSQKLSERWSQKLAAGHETTLDWLHGYIKSNYLNYGLTRHVCQNGQLTTSAFFESSCTSIGSAYFTITNSGLDLHYTHRISERLSTSIAYSLLYYEEVYSGMFRGTTSQFEHIAGASVTYALTTNTQARLCWQEYYYELGRTAQRISLNLRTEF